MANIRISVAYALPHRHFLKHFSVPDDCTVESAILQSKVLEKFPEIDLRRNRVGIFSRPVKLTENVQEGDRIEIYRPLVADPREIRRRRASMQADLVRKSR